MARAQSSDEHLGDSDLPAMPINDRHRLAVRGGMETACVCSPSVSSAVALSGHERRVAPCI